MNNLYTFDIEVAPAHDIKMYEGNRLPSGNEDDVNIYSVATFDYSKLSLSNRQNKIGFEQHHTFASFFNTFKQKCNGKTSFRLMVHNLSYEASFLLPYLLRRGYTQTNEKTLQKGTFKILEAHGVVYRLSIMNGNVSFVFEDTFSKTCVSLEELFKTCGYVSAVKGVKGKEFDYTKVRGNEPLTNDESNYIYDDVAGLAFVYSKMLVNSKITIGASAFHDFIENHFGDYKGKKTKDGDDIPYSWKLEDFKRFFPGRYLNPIFQPFYIGGFCDLIDAESSKRYDFPIFSYDRNSMYPTEMKGDMPMLFPKKHLWDRKKDPFAFDEKAKENKELVFFHIRFRIKRVKKVNYYAGKFSRTLYDDHEEMMYGDCLKLFMNCYEFSVFEIIETLTFQTWHNLFDDYVDTYYAVKKTTEGATRFVAKRYLNSLYGKMAQKSENTDKTFFLDPKGLLSYTSETSEDDPDKIKSDTVLSLYIVQRARVCLLNMVNKIREAGYMVFYCDTDSIKTNASPSIMESLGMKIDKNELGAWKMEGIGLKNVFVCPKKYLMVNENNEEVAYGRSGINRVEDKDTLDGSINYRQINIDNYKIGLKVTVNRRKVVRGGILLVPTIYSMNF